MVSVHYYNSEFSHNDTVAGASAYLNLLGLVAGGEAGVIMTNDGSDSTFGYLAGIGGGFDFNVVRLRALPIIYLSEYSVLNYLDYDYENDLNYSKLKSADASRFGGLIELNAEFSNILSGTARYTYDFKEFLTTLENQKLYGSFQIRSPFEAYPFLITGFYRRTLVADEWIIDLLDTQFNQYTESEWRLAYPLAEGLYVSYVNYWDNANNEWKQSVDFSGEFNF